MPKINRIRIANVPYNGKFIADEIIDLYQGENILINLANGSGKSVLTQMMMQPILPMVKLHQRKIESYLTSREPTFVMIEWILDNTSIPTYFLTGIVMNKAVTEDNNVRVKYFTFINKYSSSNNFDIKNIDFISKENGIIKYKSYDYCIKTLRSQISSRSEIDVFTRDNLKEYREKIAEYGIFKDEWRILANINENEGGVDEIFTKFDTSDKLIDEWILKTVSNNLDTSEKLQETFKVLIESIMENETQIKQKEEYLNFKGKMDEYNDDVCRLLESMNQEAGLKTDLEVLYLKFAKSENDLQNKIGKSGERLEALKEELENIKYEQLSEKYYRAEGNYNVAEQIAQEKLEKFTKEEDKLKELEFKAKVMEAAEVYQELIAYKADYEAASTAKKVFESQNKNEELENIDFSLRELYQGKIKETEEKIEEKNCEIKRCKEENENNQLSLKECEKKEKENIGKRSEYQTKINIFKTNEEKILKKLGITLTRNILQEIDVEAKNRALSLYDLKIGKVKEKISKIEVEIGKKGCLMESNNQQNQDLEKENEELTTKLGKENIELTEFLRKKSELKDILQKLAIEEEKLFERDENLKEINRRMEKTRASKTETTYLLNQKQEMLSNLENGGIHVQTSLGKMLKNQKIDYETGEEYLKNQNDEYQEQVLSKNPMLPYCYIVKQKDYEKIEEICINEELTRLTPIITYENIEQEFSQNNRFISLNKNVKFACLYNKASFASGKKDEFKDGLKLEIEELKKEELTLEEKLSFLEKSYNIVNEFDFGKDFQQNLEEELKSLEEKIDNNKLERARLVKENERLNTEISERKN